MLENNHAVVKFRKGDSIIKQGVFSTNVIFLRKGLVKIHVTGPYREQRQDKSVQRHGSIGLGGLFYRH